MAPDKNENIILVDPLDNEIGVVEKIIGHRYAMLHRAFSVFIFRKRNNTIELLLQQRHRNKYHAGGKWTNTCCSHPQPNEDIVKSAEQRLHHEMGILTKLTEVGKFHYVAVFDNGMFENEIDHVMIGVIDNDQIQVNPHEVDEYRWIDVDKLMDDINANPERYTPWLSQALKIAMKNLSFR